MPTPVKPFEVLKNEKKSHRTKAELKKRQQGEAELSTGMILRERPEVRNNAIAHKEFKRLNDLLKRIKKNDAIYEGIINRYCLINAECMQLEDDINKNYGDLIELQKRHQDEDVDFIAYLQSKDKIQSRIINCDKQLQSKRKMLFDIERENIMTIAAALRSIPKKEVKNSSKLLEALNDG